MEKVVLKFKKNPKGTMVIAYCDEYPEVTGTGPDQAKATMSFWKAFNSMDQKKVAKPSPTTSPNK